MLPSSVFFCVACAALSAEAYDRSVRHCPPSFAITSFVFPAALRRSSVTTTNPCFCLLYPLNHCKSPSSTILAKPNTALYCRYFKSCPPALVYVSTPQMRFCMRTLSRHDRDGYYRYRRSPDICKNCAPGTTCSPLDHPLSTEYVLLEEWPWNVCVSKSALLKMWEFSLESFTFLARSPVMV